MKSGRLFLFVFWILYAVTRGMGQDSEMPAYQNGQLEALAEKKDADPTDDSDELDLESFRKNKLNLNMAGEEQLLQLHLLQSLQVIHFLAYRKLLGPLLTIHELQAVPGWDIETIRRLLPYIVIGRDESLYSALRERWKGGEQAVLIRSSQVLEKSKGFEKPVQPGASYYEGSAQKLFLRYTYNYKNLLAYGFSGEKDAGEPFFQGAQRYGFDFYSFHFFLQHTGIIRSLALGDFTVNLGQGLIQWQTIAFTKSSQSLSVKREALSLRPYHSAGEFNFHRGAGVSLEKGRWQTVLFISSRKISSNLEADTSSREDVFSSFQNSGYHRTPAEIADRNNTHQFAAGSHLQYTGDGFTAGVNWLYFHFSRPFQKRETVYNLYSLQGKELTDYSFEYSYTKNNFHLFGELAADRWSHPAWIQGALVSLRENFDMSFLYRNISPAFQSLYSDAFTENSVPNNEQGLYTGIAYRPFAGWQIQIYYDVFIFPWLKYSVDAPSAGRDFLFQWNYQPNKFWRLTTLYKNERKSANVETTVSTTHALVTPVKQRWQIETEGVLSKTWQFTGRMEWVRIDLLGNHSRQGFLGVAGMTFHQRSFSGNLAVAVFETDGYDTRIYLYEPDLLYNFSLPSFYGKGIHYYINLHKDLSRIFTQGHPYFHFSLWLKGGQGFYPGSASIGTGLDEIPGSRKTEFKAQILVQWQ